MLITYYLRDASGNVMSIYEETTGQLNLTEQHIYGSSRLGMRTMRTDMLTASTPVHTGVKEIIRGERQYELTNHLGNVLVVCSDQITATDGDSNNLVDFYAAEVVSYSDYYPFGAPMADRTSGESRYAFNGKERDDEYSGDGNAYDFGARMYDGRLGRWWSVDPMTNLQVESSPYCFAFLSPLTFIDPDGQYPIPIFRVRESSNGQRFSTGFETHFSKSFNTVEIGLLSLLPGGWAVEMMQSKISSADIAIKCADVGLWKVEGTIKMGYTHGASQESIKYLDNAILGTRSLRALLGIYDFTKTTLEVSDGMSALPSFHYMMVDFTKEIANRQFGVRLEGHATFESMSVPNASSGHDQNDYDFYTAAQFEFALNETYTILYCTFQKHLDENGFMTEEARNAIYDEFSNLNQNEVANTVKTRWKDGIQSNASIDNEGLINSIDSKNE